MKICGIIVEYNPMHNGHLYHLEKCKKLTNCDMLIAVMSGNFVQRGEPAIVNKQIRTEMALQAGVDLVIELPYLFAVSHADLFAFGAIKLLNELGVNEIIFGSETNDLNLLKNIAEITESTLFNQQIKVKLGEGYSYPESAYLTIKSLIKTDHELDANDLLGIQYIRNIIKINPKISFNSIKRIHTKYNDSKISHETFASATNIRNALLNNQDITNYVPQYVNTVLTNNSLHSWYDYYPYLKYQIISNQDNLNEIHDINEGLEKAIIKNVSKNDSFTDLVQSLVSKRYTKAKIKRILTHTLNRVTKVDALNILDGPKHIRILGIKKEKSQYLKQIKKKTNIPIITNVNKDNYSQLKLDIRINEIYHLQDGDTERKIPIIQE